MAIPRRTTIVWGALRLIDRNPVFQAGPDEIARARRRRQKLVASAISRPVVLRGHRRCVATDTTATLPDGTTVPIRIYRARAASQDRPPLIMNYHGGGFITGDSRQSEWWCSSVAALTGATVVSVDYRLAPEHPYPTAPEDCYAATLWTLENAAALNVDASRIAVMGDSAGGNLAAVVSQFARDRGGPRIALQVLLYPVVDIVATFPSEVENATAPVLTKADMDACEAQYFTGLPEARKKEPAASPLRADDLSGLAPALIQTAQHDPLRDQGAAYADALRAAGVPARLTNYVDAVHGYISIPGLVPASRQALGEAVAELRAALSAPAAAG